MTNHILKVEHRPGEELVLRFKSPTFRILPDTTRGHLLVAQKEVLLALRSMLDRAIEKTEEAGKTKGRKRAKIEVD